MIPVQTFPEFPVFASSGDRVEPTNYATGYIAGEVYPAQNANWLWNMSTQSIVAFKAGLSSVETELANLVTAGGQGSPAESNGKQVEQAVRYIVNSYAITTAQIDKILGNS